MSADHAVLGDKTVLSYSIVVRTSASTRPDVLLVARRHAHAAGRAERMLMPLVALDHGQSADDDLMWRRPVVAEHSLPTGLEVARLSWWRASCAPTKRR